MKLGDKIKKLIAESEYKNLRTIHRAIINKFGNEHAISYRTLLRTTQGDFKAKEKTLFQLSTLLRLKNSEIRKGTDQEESSIKFYSFNKDSKLYQLDSGLPVCTTKIIIKKDGQTTEEQDTDKNAQIKFVYILSGEIEIIIEKEFEIERKHLKKDEYFSFNSIHAHHYKNTSSKRTTKFLIIQTNQYL